VLFPALAGAETGLAATGPDTTLDPPRHPALKGRVLLAEDEPTVAEFMRELLESWDLDVTVCGTGDAARDRFADDPEAFDLVLTDQTMPGLTGLELAKVLSRLRPKLPVILYTGYGEDLAEEKLRAAGVTSLVKKPVDAAQLLALLQTSLPARRPAL
jgi:CheY-like chemotaxis protein